MRHALAALPCSVLFVCLAACGSAPSGDVTQASSSALAGMPTLTFSANWTQGASQPLVSGHSVAIDYAPARLGACRGAGATLTGFYTVNGLSGSFAIPAAATIPLPVAGDLQLWFEASDASGCTAYDSSYGANYHFAVGEPASAPGWVSDASYLIDRATCGSPGGPCYADARSADGGFTFDTWARQRAAFAQIYFDVWKQGVTDFQNPDLWRELDVEIHSRVGSQAPFATAYVSFSEYTGNNARYAVDLRALDLLPGLNGGALTDKSQCPTFPVTISADGQYVQADYELYFTVNGAGIQPPGGGVFHGLFQNYLGLYAVCGYSK